MSSENKSPLSRCGPIHDYAGISSSLILSGHQDPLRESYWQGSPKWTPTNDTASCYELALAKLNPSSEAYKVGQYLSSHDVGEIADWFESFCPLCYEDTQDPKNIIGNVLQLESESPDGEKLAAALVRLESKMLALKYPMPTCNRKS